jgi:pimeloyl-ACP methyl ester carboxylesterase
MPGGAEGSHRLPREVTRILCASSVTAEQCIQAWRNYRQQAHHGRIWTGRYHLRYFRWGQGQPLVFIHGMADAPEAFIMVMDQLRDQYLCVAYALPDGCHNGGRLSRYRLNDYAEDLLTLLTHLGIAEAAIAGSSFGSLICLYALHCQPQRCRWGILQNGFAYRPLSRWERQLTRWGRCLPGWFADWPNLHAAVMRYLEPTLTRHLPAPVTAAYLRHAANTPIAAAAWRAWTIAQSDLRPLLPRIQQPVLLISADQDRLVPAECWQQLQEGLPHCQRVEIVGCGHYPQYSHPAAMAEAIETFLAQAVSGRVMLPLDALECGRKPHGV